MAEINKKKLEFFAICSVLLLGIMLRLPGADGRPFWVDELWRVSLILDPHVYEVYKNNPDVHTAITSPGYLFVVILASLFDSSPYFLRMTSFLPGVMCIYLAYKITTDSGASFLMGLAAALLQSANLYFIEYANQLKPYMLEAMIHLICLLYWVKIISDKNINNKQIYILMTVAIVAVLTAANIIFILPAIAATLIARAWVQSIRQLVLVFGVFVLVGLIILVMYILIWSKGGSDGDLISYWNQAFYNSDRYTGYSEYLLSKLMELFRGAFSINGRTFILGVVQITVMISALYFLIYKRAKQNLIISNIIFYVTVLAATLSTLNLAGIWPLGEIRPNIFLFSIIQVLWVIFISNILPRRICNLIAILIILLTLHSISKLSFDYLKKLGPPLEENELVWKAFEDKSNLADLIDRQCNQGSVVIFVEPVMQLFLRYKNSSRSDGYGDNTLVKGCAKITDVTAIKINCSSPRCNDDFIDTFKRHEKSKKYYWYIYTNYSKSEVVEIKNILMSYGDIEYSEEFIGAGYFGGKFSQ